VGGDDQPCAQVGGPADGGDAGAGTRLVQQVQRLVGQVTLGQPAGGELHSSLQRIFGDEQVVDAGEKPGFSEKTRFLGQRLLLFFFLRTSERTSWRNSCSRPMSGSSSPAWANAVR